MVPVLDILAIFCSNSGIPVINPAMLTFKPEARKTWEDSKESIVKYINGEIEEVIIDESIAFGIQDTEECNTFLQKAIADPGTFIALDSETTGLYPRDGHILGISLCFDGKQGAYISTDCFNEESEELLQTLFNKKRVVFHNAKFDVAFFEYHFNFKFDRM